MGKELSKKDEKIIALWEKGVSGPEIAESLGITRGSLMGRIFRLRKAGVTIKRDAPPSPPKVKETHEPEAKVNNKPKVYRMKRVPFPPKLRRGSSLTIMELKTTSCRYIVGVCGEEGHLYCGKEQVRGPYCKAHAELCYTPNSEQKRKGKFTFSYKTGIKNVGD